MYNNDENICCDNQVKKFFGKSKHEACLYVKEDYNKEDHFKV